jgi:murein DD-endopeptidase MepM/ murein hydrolase activator NlpD
VKVICLSDDGSRRASFSLHPWKHLIIPAGIVALLIIGLSINQMLGLYRLDDTPQNSALSQDEAGKIISALEKQISTVDQIKKTYANYTVDVDTLSVRLGSLEAEIVRLNALAKRVASKAKLDPREFSLDDKPSRGGAEGIVGRDVEGERSSSSELLSAFQTAENKVDKEKGMLATLEKILDGITLQEEVTPSSWPVRSGYISSEFGFRRDPFNGRPRLHKGLDFAGPVGTPVYAVATGVVSYVGQKSGYGNVVEVDHGDGVVSRYGHLSAAKAVEGQLVKKGDLVALLGNTGRSTGPHLHLEVIKNGEQQNPREYLGYSE